MAKAGGTLTANTNAAAVAANLQRQTVAITNVDTTSTIYVEFDAAASTTASSASWFVAPRTTLTLSVKDWPEIRYSVNLISTGTPQYVVRTTE